MSITQTITTLLPAPSRSNLSTFVTLADAFIAALENLPVEQNTAASEVSSNSADARKNDLLDWGIK